MKYIPRPYQIEGAEFLSSRRYAMLGDAPGVGKTGQAIIAMPEQSPTLIVCPASVKHQWQQALLDWRGLESTVISTSDVAIKKKGIYIVNYDRIVKEPLLSRLKKQWGLVIFDECFHQDTLVKTRNGIKKIIDITTDDEVWNCLGWSKVLDKQLKNVDQHLKIRYNGLDVKVSFNHPFLTERGWTYAKDIRVGDYLISTEAAQEIMLGVRSEFLPIQQTPGGFSTPNTEAFLRNLLFSEMEDDATRSHGEGTQRRGETENKFSPQSPLGQSHPRYAQESNGTVTQPYPSARSGKIVQDIKDAETYKMETSHSRREWAPTPDPTKQIVKTSWGNVGSGICDISREEEERIPDLLQSRYRVPIKDGWGRGRRIFSPEPSQVRREERADVKFFRVESVEVYEPRGNGQRGEGSSDHIFVDLAVEGHPSFDVGGVLVHNCHKLKNIESKRTKAALSQNGLHPWANRIWFLTGTPVKNRTIDLYAILRACAPDVLGGYKSYLRFAYRYCGAYQGNFGLDTSGASNTAELCEKLKGFMLRREKRDVLVDLPPRIINHVELECTPQVKKIIQEEELKTIEQAGENDPAMFKLGEIIRIRGVLAKYKVPSCIDYINDLLEEEEKIVIFYHHKEVCRELKEGLKRFKSFTIDGSVQPHTRGRIVDDFNRDSQARVFFGQMEACGEGIDGLQRSSSTCVFIEPSWSHTDIEQCIGRLERDGQRTDINVHILTIKDTIEARMMSVVAQKLEVDKALYGQNQNKQKENTMSKETKEQAVAELHEAFGKALAAVVKIAVKEAVMEVLGNAKATQAERPVYQKAPAADLAVEQGPEPSTGGQAVDVAPEDDVTEEAIRGRAGDIAAADPLNGRNKCIEIIAKVGGGKIKDLSTPELRIACLKELDALYNKTTAKKGK